MKLLRIDANSRVKNADSRKIADQFQEQQLTANPNEEIIIRDIVNTPIPHISQNQLKDFKLHLQILPPN
ncbi:NAD(P)H-dependent oxidoreductase [Aquimarina sp. M1]